MRTARCGFVRCKTRKPQDKRPQSSSSDGGTRTRSRPCAPPLLEEIRIGETRYIREWASRSCGQERRNAERPVDDFHKVSLFPKNEALRLCRCKVFTAFGV